MRNSMSLRDAALLFVFLDVSSLPRHREFLEDVLGLPVIENQFHPPHEHHGLVKYDAGRTIVSLNLFAERKFRAGTSDGLTMVWSTSLRDSALRRLRAYGTRAGAAFTDTDGHHYEFQPAPAAPGSVTKVRELRLMVSDLAASLSFYRDVLGLRLLDQTPTTVRFQTGSVDLALRQSRVAPDGRPIRRNAYLPVFHAGDVRAMEHALQQRGLEFRTHVGFSDIGGTARFTDPSGNVFCLYQPSRESLTWGSAWKVEQLIANGAGTSP
jgi:catechol 2,3-dioxygenase-like lactoylglutathione lyase family enzyme